MQAVYPQSPLEPVSPMAASCQGPAEVIPEVPSPVPFQPRRLAYSLGKLAKIMIVDDEPINVKVAQKYLMLVGYEHFVTTTDSTEAPALILAEMPDVILLDVIMPVLGGLEILRRVRQDERLAYIPIIILTASADRRVKREALELGATDFLNKPVNSAELVARVRNALAVKAYQDYLKDYAQELNRQVYLRTVDLARSRLELAHCLCRAVEYRNDGMPPRAVRVGRYAGIIARQAGANEQFVELIEHAAPLHDIGMFALPDSILRKSGKMAPDELEVIQECHPEGRHHAEQMSPDEWQVFKEHPTLGKTLFGAVSSPVMAMAAQIALTHHEHWDGTGYPQGLSGGQIPLPGRITAVAGLFDALSNERPCGRPMPMEQCFAAIEQQRGTRLDPTLVDALLASREAVLGVWREHPDAESAAVQE